VSNRIQIDYDDLNDPRIDEMIERERAIRAVAARMQVGFVRKFFFSSVFYTAIVGAIGGFLGWAILEPFLEDRTTISGTVKEVSTRSALFDCDKCEGVSVIDVDAAGKGACPGCKSEGIPRIRGMIRLEKTIVFLLPGATRLVRHGESQPLESAEQIAPGSTVRIRVEIIDGQETLKTPSVIAYRVDVDPPPAPGGEVGEPDLAVLAKQSRWASMLFFAVVGGMIALMVGATEGVASLNFWHAIVGGGIGLGIGFAGGLVGILPAGMIYMASNKLTAQLAGPAGFTTIHDIHGAALFSQIVGRSLAWGAVGAALALGQGVAMRSKKLIINGLLGGALGGLFGGLLFDPICKLSGQEGAELSRCIGLLTVGLLIGLFIGIVEQLSKEAWLLMRTGILTGKQFVIHRSPTTIGSSAQCDIFLFKDPLVQPEHARLTRIGRAYELEDLNTPSRTTVNGQPVEKRILRDGDRIAIGNSLLEYRSREK
jgi:hypothetical protein